MPRHLARLPRFSDASVFSTHENILNVPCDHTALHHQADDFISTLIPVETLQVLTASISSRQDEVEYLIPGQWVTKDD
jgi:hypothetical protein